MPPDGGKCLQTVVNKRGIVYITRGYAQPQGRDEYLVLWEGYPKEDASWEPGENLTEAAVK